MKFIAVLNALNTPWVAIFVIVLGMAFDLAAKSQGLTSDAANQVIGAGIGLLTGQALHASAQEKASITSSPYDKPKPPQQNS
jgi:hypothetical protein